jgi:hypothetical protein
MEIGLTIQQVAQQIGLSIDTEIHVMSAEKLERGTMPSSFQVTFRAG